MVRDNIINYINEIAAFRKNFKGRFIFALILHDGIEESTKNVNELKEKIELCRSNEISVYIYSLTQFSNLLLQLG